MKFVVLAAVLLGSMSLSPVAWGHAECTEQDARRAEAEIDVLDRLDARTPRGSDWVAIYTFYEHFGHCDNGSIGEAFSDGVVRQLANHWERVGQFVAIANRHIQFKLFVLRHIDATTDYDNLLKIADASRKHCPAGQRSLCAEFFVRADAAIKEIDKTLVP